MISRVLPSTFKQRLKPILRRWYELQERSRPPSLSILMFHEVHPHGFTPQQFEHLLQHLGRHNAFARLDEVVASLRAGHRLTRDTVVLTFDDGLRNNFIYAAPLLARYRAKATFFVVPGLIENRDWIWTHEALVRLQMTPADLLSRIDELRPWDAVPGDAASRPEWARAVVDDLKRATEPERHRTIEALRRAAPLLLRQHGRDDCYDLMTWDDIHRLDKDLIEIGSHSYSHSLLSGLSADRLEQEIRTSRDVLSGAIGRPVVSFCYPNGCFDDNALELVRQCYQQAVTVTHDDDGIRGPLDLHRLPRLFVSDDEDTLFRLARSRRRFHGSLRSQAA